MLIRDFLDHNGRFSNAIFESHCAAQTAAEQRRKQEEFLNRLPWKEFINLSPLQEVRSVGSFLVTYCDEKGRRVELTAMELCQHGGYTHLQKYAYIKRRLDEIHG